MMSCLTVTSQASMRILEQLIQHNKADVLGQKCWRILLDLLLRSWSTAASARVTFQPSISPAAATFVSAQSAFCRYKHALLLLMSEMLYTVVEYASDAIAYLDNIGGPGMIADQAQQTRQAMFTLSKTNSANRFLWTIVCIRARRVQGC